MSFNLIYADKGIDFSGFAEGVANGMKMRLEQEKYDRKLFDYEMKEFQSTWKPDKLKPTDKTSYIEAMDEYKKLRKNELRLDKKWFAKPEDRQLAYETAEKAKAKITNLYGLSQNANTWLTDATNTIKIYNQQKIVPPPELLAKVKEVRDTPSSEIDFENLAPASSYDVMPSSEEIVKYTTALSSDKLYPNVATELDPQRPYDEIPDSVPYLKGKKIYNRKQFRYMNPESAYAEATHIDNTRMGNLATRNYNIFAEALQSDATSAKRIEAEKKAQLISEKAKIPASEIDKFHLWAYDNHLYDNKWVKDIVDKSEVELALIGLDALNDVESMKLRKQLAANQIKVGNSNIEINNMYKFLNYIKSPQAEGAFNASAPNSVFKSMFGDYGLNADDYFKAIKNLKEKGSKESVMDLYNKLNTGALSLEELSKED